MRIEILPLEPDTTGPLFDGTLEVWHRVVAERDPVMEPDPAEELRSMLRGSEIFAKMARVATVDGVPAGLARIWIHHIEGNLDKGEVEIEVDPRHRRQGVGTALLGSALDVCDEHDRVNLLAMNVHSEPTRAFWDCYGADLGQIERISRLWMADTDPDLMRAWVEARQDRAADYELVHWRGPTPEHLVPTVAVLRTAMNTAPRDDLDLGDDIWTDQDVRALSDYHELRQQDPWYSIVLAPDGSPAGLTTVVIGRHTPKLGHQGDTVVLPEHRNRGLGRWLKADMWLRLSEGAPALVAIDTGNAESNDPMLAINVAMGFRPLTEWGVWQADVARLRRGLEAHRAPVRG